MATDRPQDKNQSGNAPGNSVSVNSGRQIPPGGWFSLVTRAIRETGIFRWKIGIAIVVIGIVAEIIVWNAAAPDRTYQVMFSMPIITGTPFALAIWWTLFSGLCVSRRIAGVVVVAAIVGGFLGRYEFDGFEGDMIPVFRRRSEPSAGDRLQEYLARTASSTPAAGTPSIDRPTGGVANGSEGAPSDAVGQGTQPVAGDQHEASAGSDGGAAAGVLLTTEEDWPCYRGFERDGVVRSDLTGVNWTETPAELWRHPIGAGWSSFAVVGGLAFTQEQRSDRECVVCYRVETGEQVWEHSDVARFSEPLGGVGPRATPTIADSRVYAIGATGILNCLDALTGTPVWSKNILEVAQAGNLDWAMASSPLVVNGLVITIPGGADNQSVIAFDAATGEIAWSSGTEPASYTAPRLVTLLGVEQLLIFHGLGLSGVDPKTGSRLWDYPWTNGPKVNAAIPVVVDDSSLLIAGGYGNGSSLVRFTNNGADWNYESVWSSKKFKLKFNAAVKHHGYAYGIDEGWLRCLSLGDGSLAWKRSREGQYGYGQIILAGDVIVIAAESGEVSFVQATPTELKELHRFEALHAKTWNHPVIWRDYLLIRNAEEVVCYRLRK